MLAGPNNVLIGCRVDSDRRVQDDNFGDSDELSALVAGMNTVCPTNSVLVGTNCFSSSCWNIFDEKAHKLKLWQRTTLVTLVLKICCLHH